MMDNILKRPLVRTIGNFVEVCVLANIAFLQSSTIDRSVCSCMAKFLLHISEMKIIPSSERDALVYYEGRCGKTHPKVVFSMFSM